MTDLSRAFDEELRARLASLARALRSFKIIKKNEDNARYGQILPHTAKQGKTHEELRARLASLARALRSFKILIKKTRIPPDTAKYCQHTPETAK